MFTGPPQVVAQLFSYHIRYCSVVATAAIVKRLTAGEEVTVAETTVAIVQGRPRRSVSIPGVGWIDFSPQTLHKRRFAPEALTLTGELPPGYPDSERRVVRSTYSLLFSAIEQ